MFFGNRKGLKWWNENSKVRLEIEKAEKEYKKNPTKENKEKLLKVRGKLTPYYD